MKPFITNKGSKDSNPVMIQTENGIQSDPTIVATEMNKFYTTIASQIGGSPSITQSNDSDLEFVRRCCSLYEDHPSIQDIRLHMTRTDFSFKHTTSEVTENILKTLDTKKATGSDGIPAKLLKPIAPSLSHHLTQIFNQSVDTGTFPDDAKQADVVPLFKKGDNLIPKNYRPVSILSPLSKVLEKTFHKQLLPFLDVVADRLLDVHILAGLHGPNRRQRMPVMGSCDGH